MGSHPRRLNNAAEDVRDARIGGDAASEERRNQTRDKRVDIARADGPILIGDLKDEMRLHGESNLIGRVLRVDFPPGIAKRHHKGSTPGGWGPKARINSGISIDVTHVFYCDPERLRERDRGSDIGEDSVIGDSAFHSPVRSVTEIVERDLFRARDRRVPLNDTFRHGYLL